MAYPNLLSTQDLATEAVDKRDQGGNVKASTTSTTSLSSSTSKEGVSCNYSRKAKRGGRKRKASERKSPYVQQAASSKPPPIVRRLSADKSHFKDIVHQFTGLPCAPPPPPRVPMLSPSNSNFLAAAIAQSLQTLDTISAYLLLHGASQENNVLLNEINKSKSLTFLQALKQQDMGTFTPSGGILGAHNSSSSTFDPSGILGTHNSSSTIGGVDFKSLFANHLPSAPKGMLGGNMPSIPPTNVPSMDKSQQIAELESVLLKDNNMSDNFFSLAWVLLKQMATQPTPLHL